MESFGILMSFVFFIWVFPIFIICTFVHLPATTITYMSRRIRDELANQNAETTNLTNKLDRKIQALRAQLEAAKYDVIQYCIGTLVSVSAVGLAVVRILM